MTAKKRSSEQDHPAHLEQVDNAIPDQNMTVNLSLQREIEVFENRAWDFRTVMAIIALAFTHEAHLFSFVLPAALLLTINADIGPSSAITWVATSWTLSGAVVQTIIGNCSDIFGRRNFILGGNLVTLIGCIVASRAPTVNVVIVGMVLMGVGGAPQNISIACANEIVPKRSRGTAFAILNFTALPGSAFGSVIAYAIADNLTWRWAYYLGIISNGIALLMTLVFYWPPGFVGLHPDGKSRLQQFKELDFIGLILFGGGLTSFLLGLSFGDNPYPWTSAAVLAPLVIGAVTLIIALPLWEIYAPTTISKLTPPELFKNTKGFTLPLCVTFVSGMLLISLQVLWPQEIQALFTTVPTTIGWYSLAYNASATAGGVLSGVLFSRLRRTQLQLVTAVTFQAVFIAAMASVTQHTPAMAIAFVSIAAFFVGASNVYSILFVQFGAKDRQIGVATGLVGSVRATGGSVAISVYSTILHQQTSNNLAREVSTAALEAGLPPTSVPALLQAMLAQSQAAIAAVSGITPAIIDAAVNAVKDVFSDAFRMVYLVSIAFGIVSIIAACFVRSVDDALTQHVAVKLDKPHLIPGRSPGEAMVNNKEESLDDIEMRG